MTERFKKYLEEQFRAIKPSAEAMEFRKECLRKMLDYEQDLRIKGIDDDGLIYKLCVESLGDFPAVLRDFERGKDAATRIKPKIHFGVLTFAALAILVVGAYLLCGFLIEDFWHPGWLIIVGAVFAAVIGGAGFGIYKCASKKKFVPARLFTALIIVLSTVFAFLCVLFLTDLSKTYLAFLFMPIAVLVGDTTFAWITRSKGRLIELLLVTVAVLALAYVIVGLLTTGFWGLGWLLILGGVVIDFALIAATVVKKNKAARAALKSDDAQSERYYTEW